MCQTLPWRNIRFCTEEETESIKHEFMNNQGSSLADDAEVGYALSVDLEYPPEKADFFDAFPPLAQKRVINTAEECSEHTLQLVETYGLKPPQTPKLVTDLHAKRNYHIHYRNLKQVN